MHPPLEIWHWRRWEKGKLLLLTSNLLPVPTTIDWSQPEASQQGGPMMSSVAVSSFGHRVDLRGEQRFTSTNTDRLCDIVHISVRARIQSQIYLNPFHQRHFLPDALPQVQDQWEIRPTMYSGPDLRKARIHCWNLILWEMGKQVLVFIAEAKKVP